MFISFRHFIQVLAPISVLATGAIAAERPPLYDSKAKIQINEDASGVVNLIRGPYLQIATPTSIVIRWRTAVPTDSRVRFGSVAGELTEIIDDPALTTEHIVTLTGLDADTRYFYSVGSSTVMLAGDDADHHLSTSPIAGTSGPVRIWVLGDSGLGNDDARAVRDAYLDYAVDHQADLWLMLGDNAYFLGTDDDHQRAIFDMYPTILRTAVLWPTLGNHDGFSADSDTQTGPYYDIFSLPRNAEAGGLGSGTEAYYSFDHANIHFVCLDSFDTDRSIHAPMLTWLVQDLASTAQQWVVAFWHYPPYSDGHNSDTDPIMIEMRENALPILEAAGVDLVLGGHSHSYERSFLLNGHYGLSDTLDPSMILNAGDGREDGDGVYVKPTAGRAPNEGTVYAVPASSSQATPGDRDHPAMFTSLLELGSMVIDVDGTRLDAMFLNSEGMITDSFSITKGPESCPADLTGDGHLNFFDISAFLVAFTNNEPIADFTNDGFWNFFDISEFLKAFAVDCP